MINRKLFLYVGLPFLIVGLGLATHLSTPATHQTVAAAPAQPALIQDIRVVAIMQHLGLDYSKLNLVYSVAPDVNTASLSGFTAPNTIYLSPNDTQKQQNVAMSHEYIHYVQSHDTSGTAFYPYLESLEQNNQWLHTRMVPYYNGVACNGSCKAIDNEIEAIACTEMPDSALQSSYIAWCNKYIPVRYSLF